MNVREMLAKALARVAELKAIDGDYSKEQLDEITKLDADIKSYREQIKANEAAKSALGAIGDDPSDDDGDGAPEPHSKSGGDGAPRAKVRDRDDRTVVKAFGEEFVKSDAYQAFRKNFPSGIGSGTPLNLGRVKVGTMGDYFTARKATLVSELGNVQPVRMPTIDMVDRNRLTFLDLISRGQTGGNFEYVQITGVTRNAAIVPESTGPTDSAALKPVSDMTTNLEDAKVYTYADGYDVTNQLLSDAPAFASYMNTELAYSLDNVIEDKLLNGSGVSGEPKGLLNTTGVQEQGYVLTTAGEIDEAAAMAFVKAIRRGITKVTRLPGGTVDAIVLSPEMDEAIDLLQDANDRFYGQGPFGAGPATLWGRPRVTSERLVDTSAILGDFKQVALLDREGLSINAFNQHKDYAQRNMVYVRAELRAAQVVWKPNRLVVVTGATGG